MILLLPVIYCFFFCSAFAEQSKDWHSKAKIEKCSRLLKDDYSNLSGFTKEQILKIIHPEVVLQNEEQIEVDCAIATKELPFKKDMYLLIYFRELRSKYGTEHLELRLALVERQKNQLSLKAIQKDYSRPVLGNSANFKGFDTANYSLNENERAFGYRVISEFSPRTQVINQEDLYLFRQTGDTLVPILSTTVETSIETLNPDDVPERETTVAAGPNTQKASIEVNKVKENGFFIWTKWQGKASAPLKWDGSQYKMSQDPLGPILKP